MFQAIPPLEFLSKNDQVSLSFVDATIHSPAVGKGSICSEMKVFPAECRGRRCTYRGKLVVGTVDCGRIHCSAFKLVLTTCNHSVMPFQADVSWSINGVPKGIIKQNLGQLPVMVKSQLCNLHGMSPKELVRHHEEAEVTEKH